MCGIAGELRKDSVTPDRALLEEMGQTLAHRGPDDQGVLVNGSCGLAHRRLSIIDVSSGGHQPMQTPDGRYAIVFNGEIYNYRELAEQFLDAVTLQSQSDTEVLLHLLARQGTAALQHVRGMFALALWDSRHETLLLARDPFGKKPLFYSETDASFIFASEPKALLAHPDVVEDLDEPALTKYFAYEYPPSPATAFDSIKQLPEGSWLEVSAKGKKHGTHWQPAFLPKLPSEEATLLRTFDELLKQAVRRRLVADVPVGLFLSGGLDSTTIGWYMSQLKHEEQHSFSVSFDISSFNEAEHAQLAANALALTHHEHEFPLETFKETVAELIPLVDMPLADASVLPTYFISKKAREEVKVILDGDGSDELLGGYGTFAAALAADRLSLLPRSVVSTVLGAGARLLPTNLRDFSFDFKLKKFAAGLPYDRARRNQVWLGSFTEQELPELLTEHWQEHLKQVYQPVDDLAEQITELDTTDAVSFLTTKHYMVNGILVKLDRATMYASLEARTPFLDTDLADFLMKLPTQHKRDKALLKKLMRGRIPESIIDRPKKGFGIPLGYWLKGLLHDWACETLNEDKLAEQGILRPVTVKRLLREHQSGAADHRKKLWTLLSFQLWYDEWIRYI